MSILKNTVLLFKSEGSEDTEDKYQQLLEASNFKVMLIKTLSFQYKNTEKLREKLLNPHNYSGIILSSPRCVNATSQCLSKDQFEELWKPKSNFTVGETTYKEALFKLGLECKGKESGNSKNLSEIIIKNKTNFDKPFLFPHGNLKTDTLKAELGREYLKLEEVLVYDTLPSPTIEEDIAEYTDGFLNIPEYLIFFSPSGFHSVKEHLQKAQVNLTLVKIIAIGPVTQFAIEQENFKVYSVAQQPTPEEVLNAML